MVVDKEDHSFADQLVALREADEETEEDTYHSLALRKFFGVIVYHTLIDLLCVS